jgi:hypothetical protein
MSEISFCPKCFSEFFYIDHNLEGHLFIRYQKSRYGGQTVGYGPALSYSAPIVRTSYYRAAPRPTYAADSSGYTVPALSR